MMRRTGPWTIVIAALVAFSSANASAQGTSYHSFATGFAGAMAGGDLPRTSLALGAAVTVNEESGWGADMDFSFADDDSTQRALDVTAFMVNANWTKPHGFWRPYFSGGVGALRLHGCITACPEVSTTTDLGVNAGGGTFITINDVLFVRAEGKYLWAPGQHSDSSRPDNYGFWRASIGFTFMWTLVP
jgi:Outer membrane protein beta-barrel domain